jgi:anti-sigma regulatory factor (Ser/Thr protein kinase)
MLWSGDVLRIDSANPNDLERLHLWFDGVARNLPRAIQHGMRVALEEAVMNAAMHGFPPGAAGEIAVRLHISPDTADLLVEDKGRSFDPTTAPATAPPTSLTATKPGGHGLVLLRHYCHDITYQRIGGWNRLIMRFPLPPVSA